MVTPFEALLSSVGGLPLPEAAWELLPGLKCCYGSCRSCCCGKLDAIALRYLVRPMTVTVAKPDQLTLSNARNWKVWRLRHALHRCW